MYYVGDSFCTFCIVKVFILYATHISLLNFCMQLPVSSPLFALSLTTDIVILKAFARLAHKF